MQSVLSSLWTGIRSRQSGASAQSTLCEALALQLQLQHMWDIGRHSPTCRSVTSAPSPTTSLHRPQPLECAAVPAAMCTLGLTEASTSAD